MNLKNMKSWKFTTKPVKTLEKSWKYHGNLSVRKSGNPEFYWGLIFLSGFMGEV